MRYQHLLCLTSPRSNISPDGENIISDNGILNDEGEPIENPIVLNSILNNNDDRKNIENPIVLNHKYLTEQ